MTSAESIDRRPMILAGVAFAAILIASLVGWLRLFGYQEGMSFDYIYRNLYRVFGSIDVIHDVGGGLTFGIAGFVVWRRRPANVSGPLMVLVGAVLLSWSFEWLPFPPLVTLGQMGWAAPTVLIGALLLLYPSGRPGSRIDLAWLLGAGVLILIGFVHAFTTPIGKWECPDCHSWIALTYNENVSNDLWSIKNNLLALLSVALIALLAGRWVRATRPGRRMMAPLWVAGLAFTMVALATVVLDTSGFTANLFTNVPNLGTFLRVRVSHIVWVVMPYAATVALFLIPLSLLWGQIRSRWAQMAVSTLAMQLRNPNGRQPLLVSLRQALGDPTVELALWSRPAQTYVTPDGLPVTLPSAADRAVTPLDADDGPLAAMIHDPALSEERRLIDGVSAVAQLAIENERLHAEVKAQLEEVRASRERIVSAADDERRRVERNLHDGAQQRLVSLSLALGMAQSKAADASPEVASTLAAAGAELREAINELRKLARGIHPAILTEAGLGPALQSLAEHAPVPVALSSRLKGRLPPVVEATAYFVVAEALTNVAKHAGATAVTVRADVVDGALRIRVADDGVGGADPRRGAGIRGLVDRVAALGGSLQVADDAAGGTRLEAKIPCG